jgi:ABC-type amino acid transport substrate-binding protein
MNAADRFVALAVLTVVLQAATVSSQTPTPSSSTVPRSRGVVRAAPDLETIKKHGSLRIAVYQGRKPPFHIPCPPADSVGGYDAELATDVVDKLSAALETELTLEWIKVPTYDDVVDAVMERRADVAISKLSRTPTRMIKVEFTRPYLVSRQSVVVNRKFALRQTRQFGAVSLKGEKVGVEAGTSNVEYLQATFPAARASQFPDVDAVQGALLGGAVNAIFVDSTVASHFQRANPVRGIDFETIVLRDRGDPIAMAVGPEYPSLLKWLDGYIVASQTNGFLRKLSQQFLEQSPALCR